VSVVLVSGLSGSGKSTVYRRLLELGLEAYGFDEDRFGEWLHRESGLPVAFPTERHDSDGTADIEFRVHRRKIEDLVQRAEGRVVYLCGGAGHEFHFWELLDRVLYLLVDDDTLRHRLTTRIDNGYGKTTDELAGILDANQTFVTLYRDHGAVIIDATRPIDDVVRDVITATADV
jgi:shikimate kinase